MFSARCVVVFDRLDHSECFPTYVGTRRHGILGVDRGGWGNPPDPFILLDFAPDFFLLIINQVVSIQLPEIGFMRKRKYIRRTMCYEKALNEI